MFFRAVKFEMYLIWSAKEAMLDREPNWKDVFCSLVGVVVVIVVAA